MNDVSSSQQHPGWAVVKIGGSLLDLPDLPDRLGRLHDILAGAALYLVGGSETADLVRRWDRQHHLDPTEAHWLAIRAMSLNTHFLASLFRPAFPLCDTQCQQRLMQEIPRVSPSSALVEPLLWLEEEHRQGRPIPCRWTFTSDSIAAHLARRMDADRLILLKSADWPQHFSIASAAGAGWVDEDFVQASDGLAHLDWINLRAWPMKRWAIR